MLASSTPMDGVRARRGVSDGPEGDEEGWAAALGGRLWPTEPPLLVSSSGLVGTDWLRHPDDAVLGGDSTQDCSNIILDGDARPKLLRINDSIALIADSALTSPSILEADALLSLSVNHKPVHESNKIWIFKI